MFLRRAMLSVASMFGLYSAASVNPFAGLPLMMAAPSAPHPGKGAKRRRTGRRYPHSSARQQARYARQIAAGQLSMKGVARS